MLLLKDRILCPRKILLNKVERIQGSRYKLGVIENKNIIGVLGQICRIGGNSFDVLGSDEILRVTEWGNIDCVKLFFGRKLK